MWPLALIPFCLQGLAIGFDEIYFHWKRGLPKWERIGHPLDTFSLLACLLFTLYVPFTDFTMKVYIGLAVLSCFMVTKDEFVHKEHCPGAENWLHACLFLLHPIVLTVAGLIWPIIQGEAVPHWILSWLDNPMALEQFMYAQAILVFLFMLYQIIFWNFIWKDEPVLKM